MYFCMVYVRMALLHWLLTTFCCICCIIHNTYTSLKPTTDNYAHLCVYVYVFVYTCGMYGKLIICVWLL